MAKTDVEVLDEEILDYEQDPNRTLDSIFVRRTTNRDKSTTLRTGSPTSLEFENKFRSLLKEVLSDGSRRLVLVIDNLDRVGTEEAASIWSAMRTFTHVPDSKDEPFSKQIWLVVPIDDRAVNRIMDASQGEQELGQFLVEKTFQMTLRVPPPVLSDWRNYLMSQLAEALPTHVDEEEVEAVYRLYRRRSTLADQPPTPRDIKLFINVIGSIHRMWGDVIPLPAQALYAALTTARLEPRDVTADLTTEGKIDPSLVEASGLPENDWRRFLAAIHLNLDVEHAFQVLMSRAIERSLLEGNADGLAEHANVPGFAPYTEEVVSDLGREGPGVSLLSNISRALTGAGLSDDPWLRRSWRMLARATSKLTAWDALNPDAARGVAAIVEYSDESQSAATVAAASALLTSLTGASNEADELTAEYTSTWAATAAAFASDVRRKVDDVTLRNALQLSLKPTIYLSVLKALDEWQDLGIVELFPPSNGNAVVESLASDIAAGSVGPETEMDIARLNRVAPELSLDAVIAAVRARLEAGVVTDSAERETLLRLLMRLTQVDVSGSASTQARAFAEDGHAFHQFYEAITEGNETSAAITAILILMGAPTGVPTVQVGSSSSGSAEFLSFAKAPESRVGTANLSAELTVEYWSVEDLITTATTHPELGSLAAEIVRRLIGTEHFSPEVFVRHFAFFRSHWRVDALREALTQVGQAEVAAVLLETQLISSLLPLVQDLLADEASLEANVRRSVAEHAVDFFDSLSKEDWASTVMKRSPALGAATLSAPLAPGRLGTNLADALAVHAKAIMDGTAELPDDAQGVQLRMVMGLLQPQSRDTLIRDVRHLLVQKAEADLTPLLGVYGSVLSEAGDLLLEEAEDLVRAVFRGILSSDRVGEVKWMRSTLERNPRLLEMCSAGTREAFFDRLAEYVDDDGKSEEAREDARPLLTLRGK